MNPSEPIRLAMVGSRGTRSGAITCDPAIDLDAEGCAAKLSAYERTRSDADRDALPLKPGARLALFPSQPLSMPALRAVKGVLGEARAQYVFQYTCHEVIDAQGATHLASKHGGVQDLGRGLRCASDEWLEYVAVTLGFGAGVFLEQSSVMLTFAEVGPRAEAPFVLPPGLMLAR